MHTRRTLMQKNGSLAWDEMRADYERPHLFGEYFWMPAITPNLLITKIPDQLWVWLRRLAGPEMLRHTASHHRHTPAHELLFFL